MINSDTFPLLESKEIANEIPDFDWFGGHAGVVLSQEQSIVLKKLWFDYLQKIIPEFKARLSSVIKRNGYNDQFYFRHKDFPCLMEKE